MAWWEGFRLKCKATCPGNTPSVCSLRSQPPSPRGRLNSLSQSLAALPAPSQASSPSQALTRQIPPFVTCGDIFPRSGGSLSSKGEPLAKPVTWHLSRKLYRHAKASPFGRGGCERSEQTERARLLPAAPPLPQEAGAANAVFLHDPTREKANRENPQIFPIGKFKIILP